MSDAGNAFAMSEKKKRSVLVVNGEALVGFDLGTTYSKAAFIDSHHLPRLVPLGGPEARGIDRYQMPSVGLLRSDRLIVGDQLPPTFEEDDVPIRLPKRFLADPRPRFPEDRPRFSAAEVCAQILKRLKERTETYLGRPVKRVVLTIPPSFGSRQRAALLRAAGWADLEVVDLVEEPVAAAVYDWMVEKKVRPGDNREPLGVQYAQIRAGQSTMLVFDLGGGTLDISLLRAQGMDVEVLETWAGGEFLGGADFTQAIADWIASEIRGRTGFDPVFHLSARDKINQAAEVIKRELTENLSTTRNWKKRGFKLEINRQTYAGIVESLLSRASTAIDQAAKSAENQLREPVKHLLVVGAGSRAHGVREMIDKLNPKQVGSREFPEDGSFWVALGAATMAWLKTQESDEKPEPAGESKKAGHRVFQLRRKNSLNLGIRAWDSDLKDHVFRVILKANAALPAEKTVRFGKVKTHQSSIRLKVLESPTNQLSDAKSVGEFVVDTEKGQEDAQELSYQSETSLEKDPDREAEIKVTLAYDITGQVKVSVLDRRTARKSSKVLEPEPFDVENAESSIATDPLAPPPAAATQDDEIKRFKKQLKELSDELDRVKKARLEELPPKTAKKAVAVVDAANQPTVPEMASPASSPEMGSTIFSSNTNLQATQPPRLASAQSPPPAAKQNPPIPQITLDVESLAPESGPIQTVFDDDSAVLEALSGAHEPVMISKELITRFQQKSPAHEPATPQPPPPPIPLATRQKSEISDQEEELLDLEEEEVELLEEEMLEDISVEELAPSDEILVDEGHSIVGINLDLGVNLHLKDERLQGLTYAFKLVLIDLMKKPEWRWNEFADYCQSNHTAPKVVFERLNQWSNQKYQQFILRREKEQLIVNRQIFQ